MSVRACMFDKVHERERGERERMQCNPSNRTKTLSQNETERIKQMLGYVSAQIQ